MHGKLLQLSIEERTMIQTELGMGLRSAVIARGFNRSASTITREFRHHSWVYPPERHHRERTPVVVDHRAEMAQGRTYVWARSPRTSRAACDREPPCGIRSCAISKRAIRRKRLLAHWWWRIPIRPRYGFLTKPSTPRSTPCPVANSARR